VFLIGKIMLHELKILPEYFEEAKKGNKPFELRNNDRDYKSLDFIYLREYSYENYTGRELVGQITFVLKDAETYGLEKGFVVLGIKYS
jgi:hypothetical protein